MRGLSPGVEVLPARQVRMLFPVPPGSICIAQAGICRPFAALRSGSKDRSCPKPGQYLFAENSAELKHPH
jgi:hypothetical protein